MEKSYKISRITIAVITFILFSSIINGSFTVNPSIFGAIISLIFAAIAFGLSFPSTLISRKLINIGNKLESKILRVLYYVIVLPVIAFFIFYGMYAIVLIISDLIPNPNEMGAALGKAIILLFWIAVGTIGIVLPYIQTLIVLILNRYVKDE